MLTLFGECCIKMRELKMSLTVFVQTGKEEAGLPLMLKDLLL